MTPTEMYKRAESLFNERTKRELADMVVHRESDLEDARAENADLEDAQVVNEHMRLKDFAVMGELQEENDALRDLCRDMYQRLQWADVLMGGGALDARFMGRARELGVVE